MIKELKDLGGQLFNKRQGLLSFWQHTAENFYPERADFTVTRNSGDDFAKDVMSSYPMRARRDLGNLFGTMLKKTEFKMRTNKKDREDTLARQWLDRATKIQVAAMTDRVANLARATKEGDHDVAAFGQCVITTELNMQQNALLYRCWHLRDVAWMENIEGKITTVYRKWKPTVSQLCKTFPKTVNSRVRDKLEKNPYDEVNVWHCVMPTEDYSGLHGAKPIRQPFVSIFIDVDNDAELECVGSVIQPYTIPRWQTVTGSQYAASPAVTASISDARAMQIMMQTILEAGEKAVNPPMIGYPQALRSDLQIFAGGFTAVDREYDDRTGAAIKPLEQGKYGIPIGLEILDRTQREISEAWFLNKLNLPPQGTEMTAYEASERVKEFVRNAMPLIQPLEAEYPAAICENTFVLLMANGVFGSVQEIPESIQGADVMFVFESPLTEAEDRIKSGKLVEFVNIIKTTAEIDPDAAIVLDVKKAVRDTGLGSVPAEWLRTESDIEQITAQRQAMQEKQTAMAMAQQQAMTTKTEGEAMKAEGEAMRG